VIDWLQRVEKIDNDCIYRLLEQIKVELLSTYTKFKQIRDNRKIAHAISHNPMGGGWKQIYSDYFVFLITLIHYRRRMKAFDLYLMTNISEPVIQQLIDVAEINLYVAIKDEIKIYNSNKRKLVASEYNIEKLKEVTIIFDGILVQIKKSLNKMVWYITGVTKDIKQKQYK